MQRQLSIAFFPLIILAVLAIAVLAIAVFAAIRHGYGKALLIVGAVGLGGLLLAGFATVGVQNPPTVADYSTSHTLQSPLGFAPPWIMLLAPAFAGLVLWTAFQRRDRVAGQMLVPLLMAGVCFGGVFAVHVWSTFSGSAMATPAIPEPPAVPGETSVTSHLATQPSASATPTGPAPSQILFTTGNAKPIPIQELPGWRKNPPNEGDLNKGFSKYVLTSKQFATVEEAEAELFETLTADVQRGFAHHWPDTVGWVPTREDITQSGLITERVDETLTVKVGEFENPVHRVSWLVEFRPDTNQTLHARWYPLEAERRSKLILSALAGVAGLMGVAAMALRRRQQLPATAATPAKSLA